MDTIANSTHTDKIVHIYLFGGLAEEFGKSQTAISIAQPIRAQAAFEILMSDSPSLFAKWQNLILYAVNEEHANADHVLQAGDSLALMPPLAGG